MLIHTYQAQMGGPVFCTAKVMKMNSYLSFIRALSLIKKRRLVTTSLNHRSHALATLTAAATTHATHTTHTVTSSKSSRKKNRNPLKAGTFLALLAGAFLFAGVSQAQASSPTPTPTQLTITGQCFVENKVYNGSTAATSQTSGGVSLDTFDLVGDLPADEIFIESYSLEFATKDAGDSKTIIFNTFTIGTTKADSATTLAKYSVSNLINSDAGCRANISAKELSITAPTIADKTYDGSTAASATLGTLSGLVPGETITVTVGNADFNIKDVGASIVTVNYNLADRNGYKASNYTLPLSTVNKKISA